jgi:hypothetical protein
MTTIKHDNMSILIQRLENEGYVLPFGAESVTVSTFPLKCLKEWFAINCRWKSSTGDPRLDKPRHEANINEFLRCAKIVVRDNKFICDASAWDFEPSKRDYDQIARTILSLMDSRPVNNNNNMMMMKSNNKKKSFPTTSTTTTTTTNSKPPSILISPTTTMTKSSPKFSLVARSSNNSNTNNSTNIIPSHQTSPTPLFHNSNNNNNNFGISVISSPLSITSNSIIPIGNEEIFSISSGSSYQSWLVIPSGATTTVVAAAATTTTNSKNTNTNQGAPTSPLTEKEMDDFVEV